jgi:hypothetical protein
MMAADHANALSYDCQARQFPIVRIGARRYHHAVTRPASERAERIELRVAAAVKPLIKRAMAVSRLTAGELAYEGARQQHQRMVLRGLAGSMIFPYRSQAASPRAHSGDADRATRT